MATRTNDPGLLAPPSAHRPRAASAGGAALDSGERRRSRAGGGVEPLRLPAVLRPHGPAPRGDDLPHRQAPELARRESLHRLSTILDDEHGGLWRLIAAGW